MSNISIGKLYPKDIKKFQKFINKHWEKKHIFSTNEEILNWQYGKKNNYNFIIAKKNNNVIGVQGFVPLNHFDKNLGNYQIFQAFHRDLTCIQRLYHRIPSLFLAHRSNAATACQRRLRTLGIRAVVPLSQLHET